LKGEPLATVAQWALIAVFGGFAVALIAESLWPKYSWTWRERLRHLSRNFVMWLLLLLVVNALGAWLVNPLLAAAAQFRLGLLSMGPVPYWLAFVVGFVSADFSDYVLHRASHQWRPLWLLHAVHHSDQRLDVSSSLRQHPLFYVAVMALRVLLTFAIGAPIESLAVRDIASVVTSHLHHAAIAWTPAAVVRWQRWIGWLIVTPAAHWMHHDPDPALTNSNYGQFFSLWDHLFGTFRAPQLPTTESGLDALRAPHWHTVGGMLRMPWRARRYPKF
jgi:sterol desaturase/sphingolipid hydroxylase (fatty acid hydroxylase superfamily)